MFLYSVCKFKLWNCQCGILLRMSACFSNYSQWHIHFHIPLCPLTNYFFLNMSVYVFFFFVFINNVTVPVCIHPCTCVYISLHLCTVNSVQFTGNEFAHLKLRVGHWPPTGSFSVCQLEDKRFGTKSFSF